MPQFEYAGMQNGKSVTGFIIATDQADAGKKLRAQKINPTKLNVSNDDGDADPEPATFLGMQVHSDKLKEIDIMMFTKKLETMIKSDLPIMDALKLARRQAKMPGMIKVTKSLIDDLNQGHSFSEGLEKFPQYFDDSYINMIRAGESSGQLAKFLNKIVELAEKKIKITKDIKGALTYPVILLTVALLVTIVMLIKVVPIFAEIYGSLGAELPASTQKVIIASEFMKDPSRGGVLFGTIFTALTINWYLTKKMYNLRKFWHGLSLKLPAFGDLIMKSIYAKIAMVLANLLSAGVSIIDALDISSKVTNNILVKEGIDRVKIEILEGKSLSQLFAQEPIFPMEFSEFMKVGEKTGSVDEMFTSIAVYYEAEVDNAVGGVKALLEPVMIVLIGAIIAGLLLTLYQPIFSMGDVIK